MTKKMLKTSCALMMTSFIGTGAIASELKIVSSIKPVYSLVSSVIGDVEGHTLLVEGAASPHGFALKPSQAQNIQDADVVFWIGHELELFLEKPLETIGADVTSVELIESPGIELIEYGEGEDDHVDHDHDEEKHDDHDNHDHDHEKEEHAEHDHDEEEHAGHDDHEGHHHHDGTDPHIWLNPENAVHMLN